jgi:glucosamine--fructose-6-phosphate aminotransferase (isomerizing)
MCGLIGLAVSYEPTALADLAPLGRALEGLRSFDGASPDAARVLDAQLREVEPLVDELVVWAGFRALAAGPEPRAQAASLAQRLGECAQAIDRRLALGQDTTAVAEPLAAVAVRARDAAWRIERDALENDKKVRDLAQDDTSCKLHFELWRLNLILNQLERLEVRGRDSGGLGTIVHMDPAVFAELEKAVEAAGLGPELGRRRAMRDLRDGAILVSKGTRGHAVTFVHKIAREVGELGANVRELRARIRRDRLWRLAVSHADASVQTFAHTRWASNGIINEANCHPLSNEVDGGIASEALTGDPATAVLSRVVLGALNGDIDNYPEVVARHAAETGRPIPAGITTDAKVIATEVDRAVASTGGSFREAFARALRGFEGSTAIVALGSDAPGVYSVALRGSGQAVYVGLLPRGGYVFASELYGIVEVASRFYKLNGESERVAGDARTRGEMVFLEEGKSGPAGISLQGYDGTRGELSEKQIKRAPITTRDIDRGGFDHYLLKEITESPRSVQKTLRGKFVIDSQDSAHFLVGTDVIPDSIRSALSEDRIKHVYVIGQGTACVAARAVADFGNAILPQWHEEDATAGAPPDRRSGRPYRSPGFRGLPATELSGFHLDQIDASCLVIAISQSGTTTDTNRTVDLARQKGAHVLAVVNRRGSDLADKSHGVLYTSDGRDVEMSVASTKAFYCQVVGGYVLMLALADAAGWVDFKKNSDAVRLLRELNDMPRRLEEVLQASRDRVRLAAGLALPRRHWALVGSGPLRHAADEVRIKLSELCYKSIAVDTIEDKKHIDLSSEPLILVCAAGLSGAAAADAVKEVAIFRAHHAAPVVVCDRGETRFSEYALATVEVPPASPHLALLLNALVGHLFGYECARAIDALGAPLRRAREATEAALAEVRGDAPRASGEWSAFDREPSSFPVESTRTRYRNALEPAAREALEACGRGRWNSAIEPDLALKLGHSLRLALGQVSLTEGVEPRTFSFQGILERALEDLTRAIDALKRPIDAIKHQAKTVTVGISRDAAGARAARGVLAQALADAGVDTLAQIVDADGAALAALAPSIASVEGAVVYAVTGLDPLGAPLNDSRIQVVKKTGIATKIRSRADRGADLTGTKRKLVTAPRVLVGRGERDKRSLVMCPLYERGVVRGLGLLHVEFAPTLAVRERARALKATGRYEDVRCAVTEVDVAWDDRHLEPIAVDELLTAPVERLAERIVAVAKSGGDAPAPPPAAKSAAS